MGKNALNIGLGIAGMVATGGWMGAARGIGLMALGSLISSGKNVQGSRLSELGVTLDSEGAEIPRGWGTWRQGLRLVWSSRLIEHKKKKRGGKGGPTITEYSYSTKLLYLGGRGPITRINRIKLNQYAIYDWNGGQEKGCELTWSDGHWSGRTKGGITIRVYPGTLMQPVDTLPETDKGVEQWTNYPNQWLLALEIDDLKKYNNSLPQVTVEPYYNVVGLQSIIEEIGGWADLTQRDFDLRQLAGLSVAPSVGEGFVVDSRKAAAEIVGELMDLYHFSMPEVDGVLRAVRRPSGFVAQLDENAMRTRVGYERDASVADSPLVEADENALPQIKEMVFRDVKREYAAGYRYARREGTGSRRKSSVSTGAALTGARAAGIARVLLAEEHAASRSCSAMLGLEHLRLAAGDEALLQTSDGLKPFLIDSLTTPFFGPLEARWIGTDPLVYGLPLPPDTSGLDVLPPAEHGLPILFVGECPSPPADSKFWSWPSFIVGVAPFPGDSWDGAVINLDRQSDGATEWKEIAEKTLSNIATIGELTAPWTPTSPERGFVTTPMNCKVWGDTLANCPVAAAEIGANLILFENGVMACFASAQLSASGGGANFYVVSQIQSGLFGSDDLLGGAMPAGTRFIVLSDSEGHLDGAPMWFDWSKARESLGTSLRLRVNVAGNDNEQLTTPVGTFAGRNVQPPSSVIEAATRLSNGDLRIVGRARSRDANVNLQTDATRLRLDEAKSGGAFKFLVTLESGGQSRTLERLSPDDLGAFDWTITADELSALFGQAPGALSGAIALDGKFGLGRSADWNQTEEI